MKDICEVTLTHTLTFKASSLAKGVAEPLAKAVDLAIPFLHRITEAVVQSFEAEKEKEVRKSQV